MLKPFAKYLLQRARRARLELAGIKLGSDCTLGSHLSCRRGISPRGPGRIALGPSCQLEIGTVLHAYGGKIELGENVFLGPYAVIYGHGGVVVGADSLVSMHCRILSSNHTVPAVSRLIRGEPDELLPTHIGRDVWLGAGVTILGGVTIGDGCVVGAGAVVTKDLPAGAIAHGVPATVKGYRSGS